MLMVGSALICAMAQSSSQEFPTPIISNELSGTIKARDLGDARLTTYYFAFNGEQGDVFINLVTRNLTGDFDVFTANGLKPLTKIVVYADLADSETGRAVYLRKPERLLLRIQGRTPNDEPASYRLKFAGSFAALRPEDVPMGPDLPKVETQGVARVNSVGTLLPPPPKPAEPIVEKEKVETEVAAKTAPTADAKPAEAEKSPALEEKTQPKATLIVTDPLASAEKADVPVRKNTPTGRRRASARRTPPKPKPEDPIAKVDQAVEKPAETKPADAKPAETNAAVEEKSPTSEKPAAETNAPAEENSAANEKAATEKKETTPAFRTLTGRKRPLTAKKPAPEPIPDPLASIKLVIQFKDGNLIEKPMSEVFKFSVDKGVLTVALKDGSTTRYKILDVEKVTIQ